MYVYEKEDALELEYYNNKVFPEFKNVRIQCIIDNLRQLYLNHYPMMVDSSEIFHVIEFYEIVIDALFEIKLGKDRIVDREKVIDLLCNDYISKIVNFLLDVINEPSIRNKYIQKRFKYHLSHMKKLVECVNEFEYYDGQEYLLLEQIERFIVKLSLYDYKNFNNEKKRKARRINGVIKRKFNKIELLKKIKNFTLDGNTTKEIANKLNISDRYVRKLKAELKRNR